MPLRAPQVFPNDQRSWDQWTRNVQVRPDDNSVTTITVEDKAVTDQKLRDSQPTSVIGRTTNTLGPPADIIAGTDDKFLIRRSGVLAFGTIGDSDIPAAIARDTEVVAGDAAVTTAFQAADTTVASNAAAALAAHVAAADPHPVYLTQTEGDARYAQLSTVLTGSATYDPPSLADGAGTTTTVTCTGAVLGGFARASFSLDLQGITLTAYISATNTVSVRFQNESGGVLDIASGTLKVRVDP
jgi:hypothetical protein